MPIFDWFSRRIFNTVHRNNLVYNTCWEDPRLDRIALNFQPDDNVLVITSAGCNALDYALAGANHVYAVDMNPRQNALLELKQSAIRNLEFDAFFKMFGDGHLPDAVKIYHQSLRGDLSEWSQGFWDKKVKWFQNRRRSFYYRGTSGAFARLLKIYTDRFLKIRPQLNELMQADSLERQREIYERELRDRFWTGLMKFTMNRDTTLSMLGVPKAQRKQIENQYDGGILQFMQDRLEEVLTELPMEDNYFWRLYMNGHYEPDCCPEYLKQPNFERLKGGIVDRISTNTDTVQGFLSKSSVPISKFVLLDHMDWLSDHFFPMLEAEWQSIIDRSSVGSRVIWRSGGLRTDFIDHVMVKVNGQQQKLPDLLTYNSSLASELHPRDRVHTYGSFYIADLSA